MAMRAQPRGPGPEWHQGKVSGARQPAQCSKCFPTLSVRQEQLVHVLTDITIPDPQVTCEVDAITIPTSQTWKVRHREAE